MTRMAFALSLVTACAAPSPARAPGACRSLAPVAGIERSLIASAPIDGAPGWELRTYAITYGPGVAAAPHVHPVRGVGVVVAGRFESRFDGDDVVTTTSAGESFVDAANRVHRVFRNPDAVPLRFVITYAVRTGEPVVCAGD